MPKRKSTANKSSRVTAKPSPERSAVMRAVRDVGTRPELLVRAAAAKMGFRPVLNDETLPGCPDLSYSLLRKAIFVHGCFWHGHTCVRGRRIPKTNRAYWVNKVRRNRARDRAVRKSLRARGWAVATVWECRTNNADALTRRLMRFLSG
jgi:DNA mismatch endonuclease, patch repair protein